MSARAGGRSRLGAHARQAGLTLVELLVALAVSMLVVIASLSFVVSSSSARTTQETATELQDTIRFVSDLLTRNIQQAGFQSYVQGTEGATKLRESNLATDSEPSIRGWDDAAPTSVEPHGAHDSGGVNDSDILVLRFQGMSAPATPTVADGSIVDCRGQPQAAGSARVHSVFEVYRASASAEPELRCKFLDPADNTFKSESIARGVESMQLLFGIDTNSDMYADTWKTAKQVDSAAQWQQVVIVRVGLLIRADRPGTVAASGGTFKPLGDGYTLSSAVDPGATLTLSDDRRLRQVVTLSVNVRNQL